MHTSLGDNELEDTMKTAVVLLIAVLPVLSCTRRHMTTEDSSRIGPNGFPIEGTHGSLKFGDEEVTLEYAASLMRRAEYAKAAEAYLSVYRSSSAKAEYREQALLGLGIVYADLLNPDRDYARALQYLETLSAEFPESPLRERAEQKARDVRKLQGNNQ